MLTGDNQATAEAVASQIGIDTVHAELLPEQKVTYVKKNIRNRDIGLPLLAMGSTIAHQLPRLILALPWVAVPMLRLKLLTLS